MKFLSPEVTLYLYKSTIQSCMEYCCHIWTGALAATWSCQTNYKKEYAGLLVLHLLLLLNHLSHHRNVARLSLFYMYYFGRYSSELSKVAPFPFSQGRSTPYSDRLHDFSVTIPRCCKYVYVNSFFSCTARLRYYLPRECFPLTYNLNGFKSRINRHLLTVSSF